ncbi:DUF1636 family protein [Oceaniglobus roseus]|uniref:DUF1636 family protein n=1 Tax=Oceaniglobus roseus TaxID=1737570 RepID=UPI000C7EBDB5|nr:DUF1636 family protein [Kandeliimicrobium roseum]
MSHEIVICGSCRSDTAPEAGAALVSALEGRLPEGFRLTRVDCMSICAQPVSLAFRAPGKALYLFAGIGEADVGDVLAFAALFAASGDGEIADARPAGRLRFCLRGRVPV